MIWLKKLLKIYLKQLEKQGIFEYEEILKLIKENKDEKIDASYSIWSLLAIQSWINLIKLYEANNTRP